MPFVEEILKFKSVSIVGMEKNTGKTECLNYILNKLKHSGKNIAVSSIGIDGEGLDLVTKTQKPEITLNENTIFVTSETHYRSKQLDAIILNVSKQRSALGRMVTARVKAKGKVMLSGPSDTIWLKKMFNEMDAYGVDTTLVDGALSRQSFGSPAITQCMILTTGAALSASIPQLVSKTAFTYDLIQLPLWEHPLAEQLLNIQQGLWAIDNEGQLHNLEIESAFLLESNKEKLFNFGSTFYVSGALSNALLNFLRIQKGIDTTVVIVKDFTRVFADKETIVAYLKSGGQIKVLLRTNLIAVCVNPISPQGYVLNSKIVCEALSDKLHIPVVDIRKIEQI